MEEAPAGPFDQAVTIGDVTIGVTANAGAFPAGSALQVTEVSDDEIARAVEAAIGAEGICTHRQYRVEVLDAAGNVILPDFEQGAPVVRVEGLNLPADARVAFYDEYAPGAYELEAAVDVEGSAIAFDLMDMTVYDIITVESQTPSSSEEAENTEAPTDGADPTEEPTDDAAEDIPAEDIPAEEMTSLDPADAEPAPDGEASEDAEQEPEDAELSNPCSLSSPRPWTA